MKLNRIKDSLIQRLNHFLYESRGKAYTFLKVIRWVKIVAAVSILIYIFGFEPDTKHVNIAFNSLNIVFGIFVTGFLIRWFYAFKRFQFIKNNKFEGVLVAFIVLNTISRHIFDNLILERILENLGFVNYPKFYQTFVSLYILVIIGLEFIKASSLITKAKIKPATTFILSFLAIITIGTGFLILPATSVQKGSMPLLEAVFTSVSASCVTGLIVVDTATYFTFKGHLVLLVLIQLGGLGIVSFATFFASLLHKGIGLKQQLMMQDFLSSESLSSTKGLLKQIIIITCLIECLAFFFIFFSWGEAVTFSSLQEKIFVSLFHAVSAFCNAGFSLYTESLYTGQLKNAYVLHIIIAAIVIFGGLGFSTIQDIFSPKALRERLKNPWKDWKLGTKIAIYVSIALLLLGTCTLFLLEKDNQNTLGQLNFTESIIASFFQSAVARTAGFNSINITHLTNSSLIIMMFLMFIGASSGSVGGGIKTSTFYIIFVSALATIRGKQKIEVGRKQISNDLIFKCLSIFIFATSFNALAIFLLTITEPKTDIIKLAFEQISAFGTVGLSTGITAQLSSIGKIIIICSMFLGRVGTLTFALALSNRVSSTSYEYPKVHLMVG